LLSRKPARLGAVDSDHPDCAIVVEHRYGKPRSLASGVSLDPLLGTGSWGDEDSGLFAGHVRHVERPVLIERQPNDSRAVALKARADAQPARGKGICRSGRGVEDERIAVEAIEERGVRRAEPKGLLDDRLQDWTDIVACIGD